MPWHCDDQCTEGRGGIGRRAAPMNTAVMGRTTSAPSCWAERGSLTRDEMMTARRSATSVNERSDDEEEQHGPRPEERVCDTPGSPTHRDARDVDGECRPHEPREKASGVQRLGRQQFRRRDRRRQQWLERARDLLANDRVRREGHRADDRHHQDEQAELMEEKGLDERRRRRAPPVPGRWPMASCRALGELSGFAEILARERSAPRRRP